MAISAINAGLSSLRAYDSALGSSGFNVANANTNGFTPEKVQFQEQSEGGVKVELSRAGQALSNQTNTSEVPSGTDLSTEITNSIQYKIGFQLAAKLVQSGDEMLDSLLKLK